MDVLPARVRTFVAGCALVSTSSELLRSYYLGLTAEGWLIELARAHGRALLGSWTHDEFAAWLGLRGEELGKAYRLLLKRDAQDREELVQLARRVLNLKDGAGLTPLQKSSEMLRFRRAREDAERRAAHLGRPQAPSDTVGLIGRQLEQWRVELRLSLDEWSTGLGTSATTYRTRLLREHDPRFRDKLNQLAKDGATLYRKMAAPLVARYDVVGRTELEAAYAVVGEDLEDLRDELIRGQLGEPAAPRAAEAATGADDFLPLDLYSWLREPIEDSRSEEEETA